ncbi:asparagine synthetase B, partial [bacterium]|nr:asparagine synthetase B [bacterium]
MCGICGIFHRDPDRPVARESLRRMVAAIRHRGPDDAGTFLRGDPPAAGNAPPNIGLGMSRLSIIDVMGGRQPMSNEDGTVWVVLNGEIYNFWELREGLRDRHVFHSRADTEVIPHLYEEHGEAFVEKLRGMFAIALWDERGERLILARDRLGQKPLLYHDDGDRIAFASEFQSLHQAPDVPRAICPQALDQYL